MSRSKLTRKQAARLAAISVTVVATVTALGLTGCSQDNQSSNSKVLNVWDYGVGYGGSPASQKTFYTLVDTINAAFEKANPGVKVKQQHFGYDGYDAKIVSAVAAGTAPDVAWDYNDVNWKVLKPLDGYLTDAQKKELTLLNGSIQVAADGKRYAMPWGTYQGVWMYNKALFSKANLEPPKTIDDMLNACTTLNAAGVVPARMSFGVPYSMDRMIAPMASQLVNIQKWNALKVPFTSDQYKSATEAFMNMTKNNCWGADPSAKGVPGESDQDFRSGKTAMLYAVQQIDVDSYESSIGKGNLGVFLVPSLPGGYSNVDASGNNGFTIPKTSKNADLAWKYISFYESAAQQQLAWEKIKQVPNSTAVKITDSNPVYNQLLEWARNPKFHIGAWPITPQELNTFDQVSPDVVAGRKSVDDLLNALQAVRQQELSSRG